MILETTEQIQARLIATLQANANLYDPGNPDPNKRGLTSPSAVALWRNFLFVEGTEIFTLQQLMNVFEQEVEAIVALSAPATPQWIRDKVLNLFQYDATTPQVINLIDFVSTYAIIDATKRIVTQCSVITNGNRLVQIKTAKGSTPAPLSAPELSALTSFVNAIIPAGVATSVISLDSDKVKISADVYYDGQYSAVIQANVIAALNAFLFAIPFDGVMKVSDLEEAILSVAGVKDVVLNIVRARANATTPASGTLLVNSATTINRQWSTIAGYIVAETNAGETFADTLNFIVS